MKVNEFILFWKWFTELDTVDFKQRTWHANFILEQRWWSETFNRMITRKYYSRRKIVDISHKEIIWIMFGQLQYLLTNLFQCLNSLSFLTAVSFFTGSLSGSELEIHGFIRVIK